MMATTRTSNRSTELVFAALLAWASGCEFLPGEDDSDFGDDQSDTTETGDTDDPPEQGFRVYPRFMLQDVPAVVTMQIDALAPSTCALDPDDLVMGGYLCDASGQANASLALITIERDGFEVATRQPSVVWSQLVPLEVHLAVSGGPTGVWSPCTPVGMFETCAELCATLTQTCMVTSCATDQPQWPIATTETFSDAECLTPIESLADACETTLPLAGPAALRCCCGQ